MRVLQVIPSVSRVHGGPSYALALMERGLQESGISVTTATTDDDGPGRHLEAHARPTMVQGATRIYFHKWLDPHKFAPGIVPWLWRHLRTYDVVHIHALFSFTSVATGLLARWRGVPYVVRPLGCLSQFGMTQRRPRLKRLSCLLFESSILRHAAAVQFTSIEELEEAKGLRIPFREIVIPLAAERGTQAAESCLRSENPMLRDSRIVLYVSRLDPKKNVEGLLRAFALIRAQQADAALLIAGDGPPPYVQSLKSASARTWARCERGLVRLCRWRPQSCRVRGGGCLRVAFVLGEFRHSRSRGNVVPPAKRTR